MLAAGIYVAKNATGVAARHVESRLNKPTLVRETSKLSALDVFKAPVTTFRRIFSNPEDAIKGVVLEVRLTLLSRLNVKC